MHHLDSVKHSDIISAQLSENHGHWLLLFEALNLTAIQSDEFPLMWHIDTTLHS